MLKRFVYPCQNIAELKEGIWKHTKFNKIEFKLKCASLAADKSNKSRNATVQETRKVCRRLLHSLFAVVTRDLLVNLARSRCHFISFVHLKETRKNSESFHLCDLKCRQKLRPMILDCQFFMFRGIYHHLIWALKGIYSRFVQNVKIAKPTFSTRRHAIRMTAWTCAICHLSENLLPAASHSRRVSDLKVPNTRNSARLRSQKKGKQITLFARTSLQRFNLGRVQTLWPYSLTKRD